MPDDLLATYRGRNRLLLIFAPSREIAACAWQEAELSGRDAGLRDRGMVVCRVFSEEAGHSHAGDEPLSDTEAASLRARFGVAPAGCVVVLVGRDGTECHRWRAPAAMEDVFALADALPREAAGEPRNA